MTDSWKEPTEEPWHDGPSDAEGLHYMTAPNYHGPLSPDDLRAQAKWLRENEYANSVTADWFDAAADAWERGAARMRTFTLYRRNREAVVATHHTDTASVSGDEKTLEGVVFSDGKVAVRWLTPDRSTVVWDSFDAFERVHVSNHPDYKTEVVWSE